MKKKTLHMLNEFNFFSNEEIRLSERYIFFEGWLKQMVSGEGMVGENNYLFLWEKKDIEELNNEYETQEFLKDVLLIGSDGGDTAYGIDINGRYIEVPFIGMNDDEIKVIADNFDSFIEYIWSKK